MLRIRHRNLRWTDINMADLELDKLILHFAQSNKAEGKSSRTIAWYSEMLKDFGRFLESTGFKVVLSRFDIETVRDFVVHEQERGISPYTVQGKVRALKAFSSWLFREGYLDSNALAQVKLPKALLR
jgi:site-specific recombinase XerD